MSGDPYRIASPPAAEPRAPWRFPWVRLTAFALDAFFVLYVLSLFLLVAIAVLDCGYHRAGFLCPFPGLHE